MTTSPSFLARRKIHFLALFSYMDDIFGLKLNITTIQVKLNNQGCTLFVGIDNNRLNICLISASAGWSAMMMTFLVGSHDLSCDLKKQGTEHHETSPGRHSQKSFY